MEEAAPCSGLAVEVGGRPEANPALRRACLGNREDPLAPQVTGVIEALGIAKPFWVREAQRRPIDLARNHGEPFACCLHLNSDGQGMKNLPIKIPQETALKTA